MALEPSSGDTRSVFVVVSAVGVDEPHADPVDGSQVTRVIGRLAQFAPQPGYVDVDSLVAAAVGLVPDLREELPLGHHPPRVSGEEVQQVEFLSAESEV